MGWLSSLLGSGGDVADWNSGHEDGWMDGYTGQPYGAPATQNEQGWGGYAWGYGEGEGAREQGGW